MKNYHHQPDLIFDMLLMAGLLLACWPVFLLRLLWLSLKGDR